MQKHWVVIGGGFRAIMGAYLLVKKGYKVTVIDRASKLGGVLYSENWKGYYFDKGCHLFDNTSDQLTKLYLDVLDNDYLPVHIKYASITNGVKVEEISIPDLSTYGREVSKNILFETIEAASIKNTAYSPTNLSDSLKARHGQTATAYLKAFIEKMYQIDVKSIDANAFHLLPFKRIKFTSNSMGEVIKESAALESKVAIASQTDPLRFYKANTQKYAFRNFYPSKGGLHGFCEKGTDKLKANGVHIHLQSTVKSIDTHEGGIQINLDTGSTLTADQLLWAGSQELLAEIFNVESNLKELVHKVPMVLYYFTVKETEVSDYHYVQNFCSDDLIFRVSIPTNYGKNNAPIGMAYLCCEIPTQKESEIWKSPKEFTAKVWEELKKYGIVSYSGSYDQVLAINVPVTYKIPIKGYYDELNRVISQIPCEKITGMKDWEFSKNDILTKLLHQLS